MKINDKEMFDYFENLIYEKGSKIEKWKKQVRTEPYGLTDFDVHSIQGAKDLFYKREDTKSQLCLLETMQKFLHEYIDIEGIEELLINNYGAIENSIFLEHDRWGNPTHIREHAKHQIKNAYLGSILLLDFEYAKDMASNIYDGTSTVTRYLVNQAEQVLESEYIEKSGKTISQDEKMEPKWRNAVFEKLREWCYEVFIVSSLLHDIGYPLEFYLRSAQELADYPPYLKILSPIMKADYSEIKAHLLTSQLFKLIDNREIKKKYDKNNHGVLSAVSLLMHFYYGGRIFSLNREQRCIIEMSAIAIYRHTDRYEKGFRMVYKKDPISYMVRLCDDLQEWDRFKLIISDKHNYLRCNKCWKLLLEDQGEYSCPTCHSQYQKVTQITNRKVNYISLCDELDLQKQKDKILITVDFSIIKQLEILMDDYTAVLRRAKDMEAVQEFVKNQQLKPAIDVSFFLSNNPIMLIQHMIEESGLDDGKVLKLINKQTKTRKENLSNFFEDYKRKRKNNPFGERLEKNELKYADEAAAYVKQYYGEIYSLYKLINR